MTSQIISAIFVISFLGAMMVIGIILQRRVKTADSFLTGGRSIGVILAAGMFAATFLSGSSIVGYTGFLYGGGWTGFTAILGTVLSLLIVGSFLVKKIRAQAGENMETVADLLADRYGSRFIRGIAAIMIVFLYTIFTGAETIGIGKTLSSFLGWDYSVAVVVSILFTISFVLLGGMFAVAINDTICGFLGIGGILILAIMCVSKFGGIGAMNTELAAIDPALVSTFTDTASVIAVIGNAAVWGIGNSSHPVFLAQTFSTKSNKSVLKSMAISSVIILLFYFAAMMLGASSRILIPGLQDVDFAFPSLVQYMLSPIPAAILLTSVIALIISTVDSCLLTAGAAIGNDFLVKTCGLKINNDKKRLFFIRIGVVIVALMGMALALIFGNNTVLIFQMFNFGASGAVFWVPIVFGLYSKRANKQGAIASMIGGIATYIIWYIVAYTQTGVHPVLVGTAVAIILMVVVSRFYPAPSEKTIKQYFPETELAAK